MHDGEHQTLLIAHFQQDSEKGDRIRPPGNGYTDPVSGSEKGMLPNVAADRSVKRMHGVYGTSVGRNVRVSLLNGLSAGTRNPVTSRNPLRASGGLGTDWDCVDQPSETVGLCHFDFDLFGARVELGYSEAAHLACGNF